VACDDGVDAHRIVKQKPAVVRAASKKAKSRHDFSQWWKSASSDKITKATLPTVSSGVPTECVEEMIKRFIAAVRTYISSAPDAKPLGIVLSHRYIGNEPSLNGLKGVDRMVAQAVAAVWHVELLPVLVRRRVRTKSYGYKAKCSAEVIAYTPADARYALDPYNAPKPEALPEHVFIDTVGGRTLDEEHDSGSSYTGNQASPETLCGIYFSVALLIGAPLAGA
jgi:hypothetical protein